MRMRCEKLLAAGLLSSLVACAADETFPERETASPASAVAIAAPTSAKQPAANALPALSDSNADSELAAREALRRAMVNPEVLDLVPLRSQAGAVRLMDVEAQLKPLTDSHVVKTLGKMAKTAASIVGAISGAIGYYEAAVGLLQTFGIMDKPEDPYLVQFDQLKQLIEKDIGALSWQLLTAERDGIATKAESAARELHEALGDLNAPSLPLSRTSFANQDSMEAAIGATQDSLYLRTFNESATDGVTIPNGAHPVSLWKWQIPHSSEVQLVWDWRMGVPLLMNAIAVRLQVIAALDPNFAWDGAYADELTRYRDKLQELSDHMYSSVKCNLGAGFATAEDVQMNLPKVGPPVQMLCAGNCDPQPPVWWYVARAICADTSTGSSVRNDLAMIGSMTTLPKEFDYTKGYQALLNSYNTLIATMPFKPMAGMIANLNHLLAPTFSSYQTPVDNTSIHRWADTGHVTVLSGDFDFDGIGDIAMVGGTSWNTLPVAYGSFDANPATARSEFNVVNRSATWPGSPFTVAQFAGWARGSTVQAVAGDFNGDHLTDIALAGGAGWDTIPIAYSHADDVLIEDTPATAEFNQLVQQGGILIAGDFDGNGNADLAVLGLKNRTTIPAILHSDDRKSWQWIELGSADTLGGAKPTWTSKQMQNWSLVPGAHVLTGDFNNDTLTDIAIVGGQGWRSIPVAFTSPRTYQSATINGIPIGWYTPSPALTVTNARIDDFASWAASDGVQPVAGNFDRAGGDDIALVGPAGWGSIPVAVSTDDEGRFATQNGAVASFPALAATDGARAVTVNWGGANIALVGAQATFGAFVPVALPRP